MTDNTLFVMQQAKLDNWNESSRDKQAIHRIIKEKITEAKKYPADSLCIHFLWTTNDFKSSNFWDMIGPSGKANNSDKVFINDKVLFQAMLAIHREEIDLIVLFLVLQTLQYGLKYR